MLKSNKSQIIGRAGERWFQHLIPANWIFQSPEEDFGIDGRITITSFNPEFSGLYFDVQIKSSENWEIKNNTITVKNLKTHTVKYWGSLSTPVMLVLYDTTKNIGYYTWIKDTWEKNPPTNYLRSKNKTLSLQVDSNNVLDDKKTNQILNYLHNTLLTKVDAIERLNRLDNINNLTKSIGILQSFMCETDLTSEHKIMLNLGVTVSYKEIINQLGRLSNYYKIQEDIKMSSALMTFKKEIINDVKTFIENLEDVIKDESDVIAYLNEPECRLKTPRIIAKIISLINDISSRNTFANN
jgi:hypothetical protein